MPSTVIRRQRYDETSGTLEIVFQSGRRYCYLNVSPVTAQAFRAAHSKGEFFNEYIRDWFSFVPQD